MKLQRKNDTNTKHHQWSEKLHHASLHMRFWSIALNRKRNKIATEDILNNIRKTLKTLPRTLPIVATIIQHKNQARKHLRHIREQAGKLRKAFFSGTQRKNSNKAERKHKIHPHSNQSSGPTNT